MNRRILLTLFAPLVLLFGSVLPARGQESATQISPTLIEFQVAPGQPYESSDVYIFNPSLTQTQKMRIIVKDLVVVDEDGSYGFVTDKNSRYSLSNWVTIDPSEVTLEPQEAQNIKLKVTPPSDAEPGGHYGIILATATPPGLEHLAPKGVLVRNIGGVGSVLLATVPGKTSWEGRIIEFLPIPFINLGPVNFTIRFENEGTVHYDAYGKIEIFDFLGGKVGEAEIKPYRVFPQKIRKLKATWERLLLIGKYRAKATIYYGKEGQEQVQTAEISFWAFPYKGALVTLATLAVVIVVSKLRKKERSLTVEGRNPENYS